MSTKLGAKKVTSDVIDFDEAEKRAKEEAERIEKLGYDPDAEEAETEAKKGAKTEASNVLSPTPASPSRGGFGATASSAKAGKSSADMDRLGMGVARLGFGQVGAPKPAAQKATGGFGSVGPIKSAPVGMLSPPLLTLSPPLGFRN